MKKLISLILGLSVALCSLFSLAGYDSYLPDISGEYVYYKDNTFYNNDKSSLRESYIGILYYDDSTLQVRFYSPKDEKLEVPETEVNILVSIDPSADHMVLTGENIMSTVIPGSENVDIVNYLHDILYDFSALRKRVINLNERTIELYQDYPQFGGRVKITYDCTIPIFNIRNIESINGAKLLECCTTGRLVDNNDRSFDNFKGFPKDSYKKGHKSYKKAKTQKCFFGTQSVELDSNWQQPMENFWTLKDDSMISMSSIPAYPEYKDDLQKNQLFFIKNFIESTQGSYTNYKSLVIETDKDFKRFSIKSEVYQPLKNNTIVNYKIFSLREKSSYDAFSLAVYKQPFINNKKYYEKIIDSYNN